MWRKWILPAALSLSFCACVRAQDQEPSLGDVARQARKAKELKSTTTAKTVLTDDSLPAGKSTLPVDLGQTTESPSSRKDIIANAQMSLDRADRALTMLAPMDRIQLAKLALEGRDVDFPGRREWEEKLFATKQSYVTHGRRLIEETKQVLAEIQAMISAGQVSPSDTRAQDLLHHARELMQDAFQTEANFQAVILEGQNLARESSAH